MRSATVNRAGASHIDVPPRRWLVPITLVACLAIAVLASATIGAYTIPPQRLIAALGWTSGEAQQQAGDALVLLSIRLPRIVMVALVGAMLACAGTLMQGLFRNPLADPALVGVSSGGALAASATIILAERIGAWTGGHVTTIVLPISAFAGALIATLLLYRIATHGGWTSIALFCWAALPLPQ